jgi:hypothetical protein
MPSGGGRCINPQPEKPQRQSIFTFSTLITWGLVGVSLLWLYLILLPSPAIIETEQAGAQIYFSANRSIIFAPGDCVTLRWQVDNIQAVYLNDQPQIGNGESQMCVTGDQTPRLNVTFQDNSQQSYPLNVTVLTTSPLTSVMAALWILAALIHHQNLMRLIRQPHRLALLLGIVTLILYIFFSHLLPLSETIAMARWLDASNTVTHQIAGLTLIGVLIAFAITILRETDQTTPDTVSGRRLVSMWGAGLLIAFGLIAGTNVTVNPLGMYFASPYPSYQLLLRGLKTDGYNQLSTTPDLVILGSSRAFTLSPAYITGKTGLSAYNMAIEGGRIEDILIQARHMRAFPQVLLIEVQEGLPRQSNDIAARAPLRWIPYMSLDTALLTVQKRLEGLLDINQFAEAIYTTRYAALYTRQPKEWPEFAPAGFALRPDTTAADLEQQIQLDIGNIPALRCDQVDPTSQVEINELIQIADQHSTSLIFYLSPWHPRYAEAILNHDSQYQECRAASVAYLSQLTQTHPNVFFLDYSQLETIGGTTDETGFFDSQHLTAANSQRLIDDAAPTIDAAYQRAAQG